MDVIPNPIQIDVRIDAIILQERDGHTRNGSRFHIRKSALQNTQATHAHDGFDLPRLDQRHDNGRALRHQHRVAEAFGFCLQILNAAKPALLAQQAKLIKRGRAFALHTKALGQQEQSSFKRHLRKMFPPHFVADENTNVIPVNGIAF